MDRPDATATPEPYRRLTLIDLMGLVVASGVGLVAWVWFQRHIQHPTSRPESLEAWLHLTALECLGLACWVLLSGLGRLRLERREPGYLTAMGVVVGSGFGAAVQLLYKTSGLLGTRSGLGVDLLSAGIASTVYVGLPAVTAGVVVTWLALGLLGAWKRSGGTRDRLGLAVGLAFPLLLVATLIRVWSRH